MENSRALASASAPFTRALRPSLTKFVKGREFKARETSGAPSRVASWVPMVRTIPDNDEWENLWLYPVYRGPS